MEFIKGTENFKPESNWRGVNINKLRKNDNITPYPPVKSSPSHTVAVELPVTLKSTPKPFKKNCDETWNKNHVHLPFSQKSLIQLEENNVRKRWEVIQEALLRPITNSTELENVICSYSNKKWKFPALHCLFNRELEEEETDIFFRQLLPQIIRLALRLPSLLQCGIPLLKAHTNHSITLSQVQIASLLANAFLCTYPRRNSNQPESQYANFPSINFSRLFQAQSSCVSEKLKCLINYFARVTAKEPMGIVTYSRRYVPLNQLPQWSASKHKLPDLFISSEGMIENQTGLLQVDFANKFVGGGVLGYGGVQEEIRFVICPELIAAQLFTECLNSTEALIVSGVERYNDYEGYSGSFTWTGSHHDSTPTDSYGRRLCTVLAIDASNVARNPRAQYSLRSIQRELNKAYVGFSWGHEDSAHAGNTVATGNWGCGAFKGDVQLKALLQLMSAAQAGVSIAYFTFGNAELTQGIYDMYSLLKQYSVTVGTLYELLGRYETYVRNGCHERITLYEFLYNTVVVDNERCSDTSSGDSISNKSSQKSPQKRITAYLNKRTTSPDFSESSLGNNSESSSRKSNLQEVGSSGLSSKTSGTFYASSLSSNRNSVQNTCSSNRNCISNTPSKSHRSSQSSNEESSLGSGATIDDMLKEAERCEKLRRKKMSRRNINSSQSNSDGDGALQEINEVFGGTSVNSSNSKSKSGDGFRSIAELDEDLSVGSDNKRSTVTNERLLDGSVDETNEEGRSPNNNRKSTCNQSKTSPHRTDCDSSRNSNRICKITSTKSSGSRTNEDLRFLGEPSSSNRGFRSVPSSNNEDFGNSSVPTSSRNRNFRVLSESNGKLSTPASSSSKDFVIQIEEEESMDRCLSPDVINSSVLVDTPVKYTQDLFSEDENSMQVDSSDNDVFDRSLVSDKLVRNTQDIFSEDEDDRSIKSDNRNNNVNRDNSPKVLNNKRNSCDSSRKESEKIATSVSNTSTNNTNEPKESEEIKLFKRIQRNSWVDLERSKKDMKCDELEKEIQIMDTSDELVLSGPRPNDSPKIRKTDKNNASRLKNKKITDYFSKEVRK